ncbi:MAG TPA: NAD-dependent epimerase/dehydratase family protein [Stellaceae bacterium]|nr:NAD-dependent epimerase/dehydratase family protein [Stellaceae bacterium]
MSILVTGAAGFIGSHVALALLERGEQVIGFDDLNDYYDVRLKHARLARLTPFAGFRFIHADLADTAAMTALAEASPEITRIVHLGAQAGVRYSLQNPRAYVRSNISGHLEILELARGLKRLDHLVYASSSSVYGGNEKLPFSVDDPVDTPQSLYAATKKADELMSHAYAHLFDIPSTGIRFFTVYGPWGRPDMAAWIFTEAILAGKPIRLFNNGQMRRDFTFIEDAVAGVLGCLDRPPTAAQTSTGEPHRVYNIGNHRTEPLERLVAVLEAAIGRPAIRQMEAMQPGDVTATYADVSAAQRDFGFEPATPIDIGIPAFVRWYRAYHGV